MIPEPRDDLRLEDVLDADHMPRVALYSDKAPHARFNVAGRRMSKYVTAVRRWLTHNIEDGSGLVQVRGTSRHVRPRVEELEQILGFQRGDTETPSLRALPRFASDLIRWGVLGNCIDVNALTYIFSFLPSLPVF